MSNAPIPCIACGKTLEDASGRPNVGLHNQPSDGLSFIAHGHYGCTVFDPMPNTANQRLEINVCDECLKKHSAERVLHIQDTIIHGSRIGEDGRSTDETIVGACTQRWYPLR